MSQPINAVVVHGATGLQGSSVTRSLAANGYTVRAAVRDFEAQKARELAGLPNVELMLVDLSDVQKLIGVYTGADAVFACTVMGPDETQQGKNMADAAKAAGVRHFVWTTLEGISKMTDGVLNIRVPGYDTKADVAEYLATLEPDLAYTNLYLGSFMENFIRFPGYAKYIASEDTIELQNSGMSPKTHGGWLWVERDIPAAVLIILAHPAEFNGKDIALADIKASLNDFAYIVQCVSGHNARAVVDETFMNDVPLFRTLKEYWNGPNFHHFKGWPSPHPLLLKYGFKPASFEDFTRERLLPVKPAVPWGLVARIVERPGAENTRTNN